MRLGKLVHALLFVPLPVVAFKTQPLISCQAGRQDREKFSSKKATKKRLNEFASSTNKVSKVLAFNRGLVLVNEGNFLALLKASTLTCHHDGEYILLCLIVYSFLFVDLLFTLNRSLIMKL